MQAHLSHTELRQTNFYSVNKIMPCSQYTYQFTQFIEFGTTLKAHEQTLKVVRTDSILTR